MQNYSCSAASCEVLSVAVRSSLGSFLTRPVERRLWPAALRFSSCSLRICSCWARIAAGSSTGAWLALLAGFTAGLPRPRLGARAARAGFSVAVGVSSTTGVSSTA